MIQELKLPMGQAYGAELHCPHCGGNNLHISRIEVQSFEQRIVINNSVAHVEDKVGKPNVQVTPNGDDGLTIRHWCEHCPEEPVLAYYFHKGTTYLEWVK
jgi:hypothetical protein